MVRIGETYRDFSLASWNGFLVPAKTPPEIIDKLAKHVIAAARDPANVAQLTALGIEPNGTTPEQFRAQIEAEQPQFDAASRQPISSWNSVRSAVEDHCAR
jgi:tripartite-type tricarboxylate transporter receptor subunit TctC